MSFQICARKKPQLIKKEKGIDVLKIKGNSLSVYQTKKRYDNEKGCAIHTFKLDKVFDDNSNNISIYSQLLHDKLSSGFSNIFLFAYGETGTGKTHTVFGNENEVGLFQILLGDLVDDDDVEQISTKIFEIYNDKIYDILNNRKQLVVRENGNHKICLKGARNKYIFSGNDIVELEDLIKLHRIQGETSFNHRSSRSHAIVQTTIYRVNMEPQRITIVDLAGSEKASDTMYRNNVMYVENANINKSLLALKECIRSTYLNRPHIPFRTCTLTKILRRMFEKESYTVMMATISSGEKMCKSTLDTLKYASYIKKRNPAMDLSFLPGKKLLRRKSKIFNEEKNSCMRMLDKAKNSVVKDKHSPLDLMNFTQSINKFLEECS